MRAALAFACLALPAFAACASVPAPAALDFDQTLEIGGYLSKYPAFGVPPIAPDRVQASLAPLTDRAIPGESDTLLQVTLQVGPEGQGVQGIKDAIVRLQAQEGARFKTAYGYPDAVNPTGTEAILAIGALAPGEHRIVLLEVEGGPGASPDNLVQGELSFIDGAGGSHSSILALERPQDGLALNLTVARNAVLLTDALALIEASKLLREGHRREADRILFVQLANVAAAQTWDSSHALLSEEPALVRARAVVRLNLDDPGPQIDPTQVRLKCALDAAEDAPPGPWRLLLRAFSDIF